MLKQVKAWIWIVIIRGRRSQGFDQMKNPLEPRRLVRIMMVSCGSRQVLSCLPVSGREDPRSGSLPLGKRAESLDVPARAGILTSDPAFSSGGWSAMFHRRFVRPDRVQHKALSASSKSLVLSLNRLC